MSETEIRNGSDLDTLQALHSILNKIGLRVEDESNPATGSLRLMESAFAALNGGRISELVEHFDEPFIFKDHALTLEFNERTCLTDYFQKARELFPDTRLEVVSIKESGNHAIVEWKLTATQTLPCGSMSYRFPVSLHGATIARVENGRIVEWSDYYDQSSSRRTSLAAFFTDWIAY